MSTLQEQQTPDKHEELQVDDSSSTFEPTALHALLQQLSSSSDKVKAELCSALSKTGIEAIDINKDVCGKGNSKVSKSYLANTLFDTIRLIDRVCGAVQPVLAQVLTHATNTIDTQSIHTLTQKVEKLTTSESNRFASIEKQLSDLHGALNEIKQPHHPSPNTPQPPTSAFTPRPKTPATNPTASHEDYWNDFVTADEGDALFQFLDNEATFTEKRGRSIAAYGVPYFYVGSRPTAKASTTIPEPIKQLIDKVNRDHQDAAINSVVVNKYFGPSSFLPEHQDNEMSIRAGSTIFTVSLGRRANISFRDCVDKTEQHLEVRSRSMYAMSQASQSYWTHRIDADPAAATDSVRYSITLRTISKFNKNSTVVLGDSNTRFLDNENNKHRCGFDKTMPGRRIETYHIREIDPAKCIGYQNIVIHVGINSLNEYSKGRVETDFAPHDVDSHSNDLINKLEEIQCLCPRARLIVSPILPTKLMELNERAIKFNRKLYDYVKSKNNTDKIILLDFNSFVCGRTGLLHKQFGSFLRPRNPLHLGSEGIRKLGTMFRDSIFRRYVDGRSYSSVATPQTRVSARDPPS